VGAKTGPKVGAGRIVVGIGVAVVAVAAVVVVVILAKRTLCALLCVLHECQRFERSP